MSGGWGLRAWGGGDMGAQGHPGPRHAKLKTSTIRLQLSNCFRFWWLEGRYRQVHRSRLPFQIGDRVPSARHFSALDVLRGTQEEGSSVPKGA